MGDLGAARMKRITFEIMLGVLAYRMILVSQGDVANRTTLRDVAGFTMSKIQCHGKPRLFLLLIRLVLLSLHEADHSGIVKPARVVRLATIPWRETTAHADA